jgi:hypothetical protein
MCFKAAAIEMVRVLAWRGILNIFEHARYLPKGGYFVRVAGRIAWMI